MKEWKEYQQKNKDRFLDEMMELLRIPSVSAKKEHKEDMATCAEAVKNSLLSAGADTACVMQTDGFPVVYAAKIIDENKTNYGSQNVHLPTYLIRAVKN